MEGKGGSGEEEEGGREAASRGRIGRKLLQPRRVVPAAPAPRRAPEPSPFLPRGMLQSHGASPSPSCATGATAMAPRQRERLARVQLRFMAARFSVDIRHSQSIYCDLQTNAGFCCDSTAVEAAIGFHFHTNFLSVSINAFKIVGTETCEFLTCLPKAKLILCHEFK